MFPISSLNHTPGVVYAIAYWVTTIMYIRMWGLKKDGTGQRLRDAAFLIFLAGFMYVTDGVSRMLFVLSIIAIGVIILIYIYVSTGCSAIAGVYLYIRAYILGEAAAAFAWQMFFFLVVHGNLPNTFPLMIVTIGGIYGVIMTAACLIEKQYASRSFELELDIKKLMPAVFIALVTFVVSNLSFVSSSSPFSATLPADIFTIRTLADFAGCGMLFAYNMVLFETQYRNEVSALQRMLEMQYINYQIEEESIALVNQKYHDLKHQIAILRRDIGDAEKTRYLDQMEDEIRRFETLNKTGNEILDTILTSKSILFQKAGIRLTTVADGEALSFMDNMDISALFGNALDNAMEGVMKLPDENDRLIHLTVSNQKGFLRIMVENRFDGDVELLNGMPKTTKGDTAFHGFGVKSIKSIAEKYGGSLRVRAEDGWFKIGILIPRP